MGDDALPETDKVVWPVMRSRGRPTRQRLHRAVCATRIYLYDTWLQITFVIFT